MSDLIDRQKAIKDITYCIARPDALAAVWKPERVAAYNAGIQNAINAINALPHEEHTKGHWIKYPELNDVHFDYYKCSECNRVIKVVRGGSLSKFPFCHCGADMRGEQSNE